MSRLGCQNLSVSPKVKNFPPNLLLTGENFWRPLRPIGGGHTAWTQALGTIDSIGQIHSSRVESTWGQLRPKSPKSFCERDALPTELRPQPTNDQTPTRGRLRKKSFLPACIMLT